MARAPDEKKKIINEAFKLYKSGMKLVEIASQLSVPDGTVRRWKCTYGWDSERSDGKASVRNNSSKGKKNDINEDILLLDQNSELTEKQKHFCLLFVRNFNATKAYEKAYGVDYKTAASISYRLLENDGVKKEILRLKQNRLNRELLHEDDIFQKYMDIAFADITDYVEFGRETVQVMGPFGPIMVEDEKTKKKTPVTKEVNVVKFKDSLYLDGSLISEVKQGKDGASIKLSDKMKALKWLADHMNLATEEQKAKIDAYRSKVKDPTVTSDITITLEGDMKEWGG
jgi:phage terminase small subunit